MPTYEYKRKDGTIFELRQGINDEPLDRCPETGQPVTRIISGGGGVVYKGEGWYVTDYRKESKSANGSQGSKDARESAASKTVSETKSNGTSESPE